MKTGPRFPYLGLNCFTDPIMSFGFESVAGYDKFEALWITLAPSPKELKHC